MVTDDFVPEAEPLVDPGTGLPALPEKYYWHVKVFYVSEYADAPTMQVSLRKRGWLGTWTTIESTRLTLAYLDERDAKEGRTNRDRRYALVPTDPSTYKDEILPLARKVLKLQEKNLKQLAFNAAYEAEAAKLSGRYPPKSV